MKNKHFFQLEWLKSEDYIADLNNIVQCIHTQFNFQASNTGIYLITPDAGIQNSINLWQLALKQGPDFASPKHFPATLASFPASFLARELHCKGPNITLIGDIDSLSQMVDSIELDVENKVIQYAICINLEWNHFKSNAKSSCKVVCLTFTSSTANIDEEHIKSLLFYEKL